MTEEKTGMRPVVYVGKTPTVTEGLTVKEALAQRFTNYKVRLPRRSGTELIERRWSAKRPRAEFNIEDMLNYGDDESLSPPADDQEPASVYELQPFWFYDVESGRSRWNNVNGIKYSFFNGLFSSKDSIMVPMKRRIPFRIKGKIMHLSLTELLYHNGIVVKDEKRMKELKEVFSVVNLMVHYRIFATFLNVDGSTEMATEDNPIEISPLHPPFVAFRPALWPQFLNTRQGVNRICDENYKYQCLIPSFNLPSNVLSPLEQLLAIVQIDTESLPEAVANNFGVSENLIDSILLTKQKILRNMTRILVERTFEIEPAVKTTEQQENTTKQSPKVRRSTYGLNALVWCLFKECAARAIKLNGKLVKKYALWIGHQIGLPDFKASEGWLDKLKKRHNMDFNEMTGEAGTYDDEDGDPKQELEAIRDELMTKYEHIDNVSDGDNGAGATGSITIKSTGPLDLGSLDLFASLIKTEPLDETDEPTVSGNPNGEEPTFLESLLRSVSTHVPNVELAYAVDLIRSYLVANDPGTLPLLADLQARLAATVQASGETPYSK